MASEQEMMADLATADSAGDHELAQHIATQIKAARVQPERQVGGGEAALAGLSQGVSMGFGDEIKAGWRSLFPKSMGGGDYKTNRDSLRADNALAQKQHPYIYGGMDAVGSALPAATMAAATGGTSLAPALARAALPMAAGQGTLQGAGYSDATTAGGLARDASVGGGLGVAGYGLGSVLGGASRKVAGWARGKAVQATAKAADKAAAEVADQIASAKGALGGEVQKGQRIVENLRRLGPDLNPEQTALVEDLEKRLTASTLQSLPTQAGTIATKDAELAALKSGASDAFQSRKAELLSTGEARQQVLARALRYGPVAAGTIAGSMIGGPLGTAVGALAGAGTRPMVQATRRMLKNPAVQKAAADFLENRATGPTATFLRRAIQAGGPAYATQQLTGQ